MPILYIYNTNNLFLTITESIIDKLISTNFLNIKKIVLCDTKEKLFKASKNEPAIFLINIRFNEPDEGIHIGQTLRKRAPRGKQIYIVPSEKVILNLLEQNIEPFSYLLKNRSVTSPVFEEYLFVTLRKAIIALNTEKQEEDVLLFQDSRIRKKISYSELLYVENFSRERKIKVVTTTQSFFVNVYLGKIKHQFHSPVFFTDSQSLIINLKQVAEIHTGSSYLRFKNELYLPVSPYLMKKIVKHIKCSETADYVQFKQKKSRKKMSRT
ncbi:LytTR family transcriptional regulator DNA-binding domain-containing protein [Enterococcus sp. LJL128]